MDSVLIVGGGNHHNTLGVIRALGMRQVPIEAILMVPGGKHFVGYSKYIDKCSIINSYEKLPSFLLDRKRNYTSKEVVISCSDEATEVLNDNLDSLSPLYHLPGTARQGEMVRLMNKLTMIEIGEQFGLRTPVVYDVKKEINKVKYPCITKALISSHGGKAAIIICDSKKQLEEYISDSNNEFFVQQYIDKKEEVQFIGCSLNGGTDVIIPGMSRILRSQPNTNTGFLEYGPIDPFYDETVSRSKQFIKKCGYSGLFSIEFLRSKDDAVFLLEINFRNDGNAWCVTAAGVNLPMIWVKACKGLNYHNELHPVKTITVMPEFQDFKLVLQRKIGFRQWLRDLKHTDVFLNWSKEDKKPFFRFIFNKL